MKSTILTKINTVQLPFKDQISELTGTGDIDFLNAFVNHCHKKCDIVKEENAILVYTSKSQFIYKVFPRYILRIDGQTTKKKFYKIS